MLREARPCAECGGTGFVVDAGGWSEPCPVCGRRRAANRWTFGEKVRLVAVFIVGVLLTVVAQCLRGEW